MEDVGMSEKSKGELLLLEQIRGADLPEPDREYRWAARQVGLGPGIRERLQAAGLQDWRFDFCWPESMIAAEVEGGIWTQGRHTRGSGYAGDCAKYNAAQMNGWIVLRFTTGMVKNGRAIGTLRRALQKRGER